MLYNTLKYLPVSGGSLYGANLFGGAPGGPINSNGYQNSPDRVVLYWTLSPYSSQMLEAGFYWELETDLSGAFNPADANYRKIVSNANYPGGVYTAASDFITGCRYVGMAITPYARLDGAERPMYWRVRGRQGNLITGFSLTNTFLIPESIRAISRNSTLSKLPDILYSKTAGETPGVGSNMYKLHDTFCKEFDEYNKQMQLVSGDSYIKSVRDSQIDRVFGVLTGLSIEPGMSRLDYREFMAAFLRNVRISPAAKAIRDMVFSIYGTTPTFANMRDEENVYLVDGEDDTTLYVSDSVGPLPYALDLKSYDFGVVITIENRFAAGCRAIISEEFTSAILRKLVQAHTPIYIRYI